MKIKFTLLFILTHVIFLNAQYYKVLESGREKIKLEFDFSTYYQVADTIIDGKSFNIIKSNEASFGLTGKPWLPFISLNFGTPSDANPELKILTVEKETYKNKFILPFPKEDPELVEFTAGELDAEVYGKNEFYPSQFISLAESFFMRYIRVGSIDISPFRFNPVTRELIFSKKFVVEVNYNSNFTSFLSVKDPMTTEFVKNNLINGTEAVNWIGKKTQLTKTSDYWYNPEKDYYKLYLNDEGVYRVTYEYLSSAGVPLNNVPVKNLELLNYGEFVPVNVTDSDSNNIFNEGDYFEFVGKPLRPSPYAKQNIHNTTNVYWFSYQGDSTGLFYKFKSGFPDNWQHTFQTSLTTLHFEKDIIYERLGYAPDEKRDYWFWGKASAQGGTATQRFNDKFNMFKNFVEDSNYVTLRVNMHGMTNNNSCSVDHKAYISINGQPIGNITWDGQNEITFEKKFYVHTDSIRIYPEGNNISIEVRGDVCSSKSDEIRINWYELDYWRFNRADTKYSFVSAPSVFGKTNFWVWQWQTDLVKIFVPQKNEMITNYAFDLQYKAAVFVDSVTEQTEYYLIAGNSAPLIPDSIKKDSPSNYRNSANGADYIIITHPAFLSAANKLKELRKNNFPDENIGNPRIEIADVFEIYDEFSYGFLDPYSLKEFVKYAFENWQQPAPSYVVVLGDMSWDYRKLLPSSRLNFVPSIPVHANIFATELNYGQAVSDNQIVAVVGTDLFPDLAIGRLSCETMEEANILIDKLINYPGDASKEWKQNVLLISSGQNEADENSLRFNDENMILENSYIKPKGVETTKVFRYPNKPEYIPFQGGGPEIRAAFDEGAIMANYYGHGGGSLWDLVFSNDDIYLLNNGSRLPVIMSITCYTAHFDNQDVFGEQFVKVRDKGAVGFYSSSGLTLWQAGNYFNKLVFSEIFTNGTYIFGKAVFNAMSKVSRGTGLDKQYALFTYLGDPVLKLALPEKPDFIIEPVNISIDPLNPIVDEIVNVKVKIRNLGIVFSDSVTVQLFASDTLIDSKKLGSFGEYDSIYFDWTPSLAGLINLAVKVNDVDQIPEADYSDNTASKIFAVFNISEPNIISPINGLNTEKNIIDFLFSDIGYYAERNLSYTIEIDTSEKFVSPLIKSGELQPADGLLKWKSPQLSNNEYFWRARIFDGENYGNWSQTRGISIGADKKGYHSSRNLLKLFDTYNMNYSTETKSLVLNTEFLPPKPNNSRFKGDIRFSTSGIQNLGLTTITTDGVYIYFANIWYYSLTHNPQGFSKIHKVGTGNSGTIKGQYYGTIGDVNFQIKHQMFYHSDGFIYAATGSAHSLLKINPQTGDTSSIHISAGILEWETARVKNGAFYITSDGRYVYNLTLNDSLGNNKYVVRTFDPSNNWALVKPDMVLSGSSFYGGFTGFFVAAGYLYPLEYLNSNYIRRIRLDDGLFEEEWLLFEPFQSYYAICYDWTNNEIYASVYRNSGYAPKFSKFAGKYIDASGTINSEIIGPAFKWNSLSYSLESAGSLGKYSAVLKGLNKNTGKWDLINNNVSPDFSLVGISTSIYDYLQVQFSFTDSSAGNSIPLKLSSLSLDYETLPEIMLTKKDFTFSPDSLLQGFIITANLKADNISQVDVDSLQIKFYLNNADSAFHSAEIKILKDSSAAVSFEIPTTTLIFSNQVKAVASTSLPEYFSYNNIISREFFVARDSIRPEFQITFDGNEIISGDVVSATPEVFISLKDNSPLPIDTSFFTIIHNNIPLGFYGEDINHTYTGYPNSQLNIKWNPKLADGRHVLEVLAKDASGNFFDSTSSRTIFYVYNNYDLRDVYNYPNPFREETHFTFELRGTDIPEEFLIRIYTIAGRLIRDISIPASDLRIGFNKIYWNGRDQDGDEIANGLYLYKVISKQNGDIKTETKKLVKMK